MDTILASCIPEQWWTQTEHTENRYAFPAVFNTTDIKPTRRCLRDTEPSLILDVSLTLIQEGIYTGFQKADASQT